MERNNDLPLKPFGDIMSAFGDLIHHSFGSNVNFSDGRNQIGYQRKDAGVEQKYDYIPVDEDAVLKLADHLPAIRCNVICVHLYRYKVKYDLDLWLDDTFENYTRIYNVDSIFVLPYKSS